MTQSDFDLLVAVRAKLAILVAHPTALEITAANGCIGLKGPILQEESDRAVSAIQAIPGVTGVDPQLDVVSNVDHLRAGEWKENHFRYDPEFFQGSLATPIRMAIGAMGLGLIGMGIRNRGSTRWVLSILGLGALLRATRNLSLSHLIGAFTVPAMRLRRSLLVRAPVDQVYGFWKDFSNFPKFMSYIRDVHVNEIGGLEWIAEGPRGVPVKWDAVVGAMTENQLISWKSSHNSLIANEGRISFSEDSGGTRLGIELTYAPPAGALGYAVVRLLGFDPRQKIDQDLEVMRRLIESLPESAMPSVSY